ncbi:Ppx/GppA phosphatase family protein [Methylococcus sp. ANG]|uniref:Ppx/GppA phosphatase family protein n=1 Tax=unclassified Methylococcus TaxID=2618889 RepID=UPI001C5335EF|nr:Ppx/GppA phosphatase family protein [Methylococcus sp. Mc7]QXP86145.1 Ppx/GppA family phosphatase [Methylococcus sp. Mc7]
MIVASLRGSELVVVDRLREMVRLAAGLTPARNLSPEVQLRALECLERFGQRVRDMPPGTVRAVGTNTLRAARNAQAFLIMAEQALGHPIEIISGIEEARLTYLGVAQSLAANGRRRMVMDIGGGSTEFIIGVDNAPRDKESLRLGCVSMSLAHFGDGKITPKRFRRAVLHAEQELEPIEHVFNRDRWDEAVGSSGTLRVIQRIIQAAGWSRDGITPEGLNRLADAILAAGHVDRLTLPELSPERRPIIVGGAAIVHAAFNVLRVPLMKVADGALREGLLYDLLGRLFDDDVRGRSVSALAARYHVDATHAGRVRDTARHLLEQWPWTGTIDRDVARLWLDWAAELHEIGLDIAHSQYQKHGAYIAANADLAGFSRHEQNILAALIRAHRRKFQAKLFRELPAPWNETGKTLAVILRLAVVLNRSRHNVPPHTTLERRGNAIALRFPEGWLNDHPLTSADLEQEAEYLRGADLVLNFA